MKVKAIFAVLSLLLLSFHQEKQMPKEFVYVETVIPDIDTELRYYSANNFTGDTIIGYKANKLILTEQTAKALKAVQTHLLEKNLCLRIYDGYRPQSAVNNFITWARNLGDTIMKQEFYPKVAKRNLFKEGYIATKSGHSRGSTVDLTIIDASTAEPLDMGSPYDFFGPQSWVSYSDISPRQKANRELLQNVMISNGFRNYSKEWWHFTLRNEPFPDTYFDFPVK